MYTYKIRLSYNDDSEDILVGESELQHAYYAFLTESRVVLPSGHALRGKDIISIVPDMVRSMGWNIGYVPQDFEWGEIRKRLGDKPQLAMEKQKLITEMIIKENRPDLLGTEESYNLLESGDNNFQGFTLKRID